MKEIQRIAKIGSNQSGIASPNLGSVELFEFSGSELLTPDAALQIYGVRLLDSGPWSEVDLVKRSLYRKRLGRLGPEHEATG